MRALPGVVMSVLESIRKGTDSTSTRVLIGVTVAFFIYWSAGSGDKGQTSIYATVNGATITDSDFRRAFVNAARQEGRNLSDSEEQDLGGRILTGLIEEEALVQEAARLGVAVSEVEVAREVVKIPSFASADGKFDEKTYLKLLKANNLTRGGFEASVHRSLLVQKLADLASRSVSTTEAELREAYTKEGTTLDLSFVRLPVAAFLAGISVSDADRDAFATQNGDRVKIRYDESFTRFYDLPKRYQLRTILLKTDLPGADEAAVRARLDAIRTEAAAGADFATLARRWSEDLSASNGGSLGLQALAQLDAAIATAADAAGAGKVTEVVKTDRGLQVLLVESIEAARVIPLDEARSELATAMLREERAPAVIDTFAAQVLQAWKDTGAAPVAMLEERQLALDTTGPFTLGDPQIPRLGADPALRKAIEAAPAGYVVPLPMKVKDTVFVVGIGARTDADPAQFDASRTMIAGRLLAERRSSFLEQWRADVVAAATITRRAEEKPAGD